MKNRLGSAERPQLLPQPGVRHAYRERRFRAPHLRHEPQKEGRSIDLQFYHPERSGERYSVGDDNFLRPQTDPIADRCEIPC